MYFSYGFYSFPSFLCQKSESLSLNFALQSLKKIDEIDSIFSRSNRSVNHKKTINSIQKPMIKFPTLTFCSYYSTVYSYVVGERAYPLNSRVGRFCTFSSCTCMVVCGSPCLGKYKNVFDFGPKC